MLTHKPKRLSHDSRVLVVMPAEWEVSDKKASFDTVCDYL